MENYHQPAMLSQTTEGLNINPRGTYVDLTYGGGGHSKEILAKLNKSGRLIVFDHDEDAFKNKIDDERLIFIQHNFRFLYQFLKYLKVIPVDGILADLGVSSHHFDTPERGFSFRFDGPLDMRMNLNATETAKSLVNSYDDERLTKAFKFYGEISYPKRLAYEISSISAAHNITTTTELKDIVMKFAPKNDKNRFLSQVFQALRIEVNNEMDALKEMLTASLKVLKKDGRIVIISYHSLEDRLVKNFFRSGDIDKAVPNADIYGNVYRPFRIITRKVIVPDENEIKINPRIRSAKLRVAEKI